MLERADEPAALARDTGEPIEVRGDHGCFGCGRLNPRGLRLSFRSLPAGEGEGVWAPFTPHAELEGYEGVVHGEIVSTVLDEVMAWALYRRGIWAVTTRMTVTFRRPVEVGVPTRAIGCVVAERGRITETTAELRRAGDGLLLATATGSFVRVPEDRARAWQERYLGAGTGPADDG